MFHNLDDKIPISLQYQINVQKQSLRASGSSIRPIGIVIMRRTANDRVLELARLVKDSTHSHPEKSRTECATKDTAADHCWVDNSL